uniref:Uncharacterized protein n=1 Tax=Arundo donax TaxID=35708 RepID=A0A0A9E238_ARUDO
MSVSSQEAHLDIGNRCTAIVTIYCKLESCNVLSVAANKL